MSVLNFVKICDITDNDALPLRFTVDVSISRNTTMNETLIHRRVAEARSGQNPTVICRMRSGYLVLSDNQAVPGWCLLLPDPVVGDLDELGKEQQAIFLADMAAAGKVLKQIICAYRINYSILGNSEPALHAHIQPRFIDEPAEQRQQPIWKFVKNLSIVPFDVERDAPLMLAIRTGLAAIGQSG